MAADRGAFIDQSQSLNIHVAEPNYGKLSSMHFYAWKLVRPKNSSLNTLIIKQILRASRLECTTSVQNPPPRRFNSL